jgi:hypothetical protein
MWLRFRAVSALGPGLTSINGAAHHGVVTVQYELQDVRGEAGPTRSTMHSNRGPENASLTLLSWRDQTSRLSGWCRAAACPGGLRGEKRRRPAGNRLVRAAGQERVTGGGKEGPAEHVVQGTARGSPAVGRQ